MAKRGAPYGNTNASKAHKAFKAGGTGGRQNRGLRNHLSKGVNYSGAKFLAVQRRQKRMGVI